MPDAVRQAILFLEQQSWRAGAERVLDEVLFALGEDFVPCVGFPAEGPFAADLRRRNIETVLFPLGRYRSGRKSFGDMIAFPARSLYCAWRLAEIIRLRDVQLIYINSPRCLVAGVIAARLAARPSLFHLHMTMTRSTDLFVATRAARYVTKIVACSKTAAAALARGDPHLKGAIQVIYNPVRKPLYDRRSGSSGAALAAHLAKSPQPVVGVVGRITPQKGQHVLLRAAAHLASRGRNVQVVLVGAPDSNSAQDASYARFLESCIRELGLGGKVHLPGYQEDPNPFYAILDVLLIPSTVSEGLPLVALEALQWGVPVIGSDIGGIPEVVRDGVNGFLVPPGDERALADRLARVLSSSELREHLQVGARSSVDDRFSVDRFRQDIRKVLFDLCCSSEGFHSKTQPQEPKAGMAS